MWYNKRKERRRIILNYVEHITLALFLAFILDSAILTFTPLEQLIYYPLIAVGSVLPDADLPKSYIGSKLRPISDIISLFIQHRTYTHSILVITIIFFVSVLFYNINIVNVSLMLGCIFHILGDLLTPSGVPILYPLSKKKFCKK